MLTTTVTMSGTDKPRYFEAGQEVYPCRCGETHRGDYAVEDFLHHNCYHDEFLRIGDGQVVCTDCGKVSDLIEKESGE